MTPYFFMANLLYRTQNHRNITVYLNSDVTKVSGHVGKFVVTVSERGKGNGQGEIAKTDISCGAIIAATGAEPAKAAEFLYGESEDVLTQSELEKRLHEDRFDGGARNIVMIQCVGLPQRRAALLQPDLLFHGGEERAGHQEARPRRERLRPLPRPEDLWFPGDLLQKGPRRRHRFSPVHAEAKPQVVPGRTAFWSRSRAPTSPTGSRSRPINVVLSTGIEAPAANAQLSDMLKVQLNADGFFVEAHVKLRPVDFATEGIFLCGLAHSPKMIDENISQARAAAARAATVLSKTHLDVSAQVS